MIPCLVGPDLKLRTVFDIDSPNLAEFDEEDESGLKKMLALIYH